MRSAASASAPGWIRAAYVSFSRFTTACLSAQMPHDRGADEPRAASDPTNLLSAFHSLATAPSPPAPRHDSRIPGNARDRGGASGVYLTSRCVRRPTAPASISSSGSPTVQNGRDRGPKSRAAPAVIRLGALFPLDCPAYSARRPSSGGRGMINAGDATPTFAAWNSPFKSIPHALGNPPRYSAAADALLVCLAITIAFKPRPTKPLSSRRCVDEPALPRSRGEAAVFRFDPNAVRVENETSAGPGA